MKHSINRRAVFTGVVGATAIAATQVFASHHQAEQTPEGRIEAAIEELKSAYQDKYPDFIFVDRPSEGVSIDIEGNTEVIRTGFALSGGCYYDGTEHVNAAVLHRK